MRAGHDGWRSLRRLGTIAPELPVVLFVAVATGSGFWAGLAAGCAGLVPVLAARAGRALPTRAVLGAIVGLAVAACVARLTGVAAGGVLVDAVVDLTLAVVLAGSLLLRRPAFGLLWAVARHGPLRSADPVVRRRHARTTALAAGALALRSSALGVAWFASAAVGWLLALKVGLGVPITLVVVAAAYAAGAPAARNLPTIQPQGDRVPCSF